MSCLFKVVFYLYGGKTKKKKEPVEHECVQNYDGSSKGMEAHAALELTKEAKIRRGFIVGCIVADDDSSMKALVRHSYTERQANDPNYKWPRLRPKKPGTLGSKLRDTGKLPLEVPEPTWLADPTHRTKVVASRFFGLKSKGKKESCGIGAADCLRLKLYWGFMVKQNRTKTLEEFELAALAPLEHLFDNHKHCGEWCKRKTKTDEEKNKQHNITDANKNTTRFILS